MIRHAEQLLHEIRTIHHAIRDTIVAACEQTALEQLAAAVAEEAGDTIFAIDRISEEVLLERFTALAAQWPCLLIAEGLGSSGRVVLPPGTNAAAAEIQVIVDPIDGTRGLMYQKRSAWILTGVAPQRGTATTLADIELAVMTEIPLVKQHLCDTFWAIAGQGAHGERFNRLDGSTRPLAARPSQAGSIRQGYGTIARFFPGARDIFAAIDDTLVDRLLGPQPAGIAFTFEDQYISTGGQFYELIMGHDRWIADLRPLAAPILQQRGKPRSLCCHPYDLCTELIAREAGIIVTDHLGRRLTAPLDVTTDVAWAGYANPTIAGQVAPVLQQLLAEHKLL
ncbi:MAG TPA: inositol monophosphatase [Roseiflexaceae bacterium]|nr:inositol monophosphatase [Roseiflexaceae bacterium]HMP42170.1 inositol monophosphatase [Roseiflexaceae bacterium]